MSVQNKRGGMYKQTNTCTHCRKEFVANRRYAFCSPLCRAAAHNNTTLSQAHEGATSHDTDRTKD